MLPIEDALEIILARTPSLPVEDVRLESVQGRILREDCVSDLDLPPFDRARMDGYAVRAADTARASRNNPVRLRSIGEAAAGAAFPEVVGPGEAVRIMTGAPVPEGADAVQKIEVICTMQDGSGQEWIELEEESKSGQYITPCGVEARTGDVMASAGERITPAVIATLATFGYANVRVSRRPRVALLSTGSELVDVHQKPGPAQIRNSNTFSLAGYSQETGAEVVIAGVVRDDLASTEQAISVALEEADVVMLSGGVSMGDYDLVKPALRNLGAEIYVEKVAMHPGKPTVFAKVGEKVIFGLPGNPVSVAVSFHLFARPALLKMQEATEIHLPRLQAFTTQSVKGAPPRRSHQPALLSIHDGRAVAAPLKWSGSSDLVAFMRANALLVVPEDRASLEEGELAEVISLIDWR